MDTSVIVVFCLVILLNCFKALENHIEEYLESVSEHSSSRSICSRELEGLLYGPKTCGARYFAGLERVFRRTVPQLIVPTDANIQQFCQKFSQENQVGLNIIDSNGFDLCRFRDPLGLIYYQIFLGLNQLSFENRLLVYNIAGLGVGITNDYSGIAAIVQYITAFSTNTLANANTILSAVNSYPKIGEQYVSIITLMTDLSSMVAASNPDTELAKFNWIYRLNGLSPYFSETQPPSPLSTSRFFNAIYSSPGYFDATSGYSLTIPQSQFLQIISGRVYNAMVAFGAASKINGFSNLLSENLLFDGICKWAFNYFYGQYGSVYRIVFYQPRSNLALF